MCVLGIPKGYSVVTKMVLNVGIKAISSTIQTQFFQQMVKATILKNIYQNLSMRTAENGKYLHLTLPDLLSVKPLAALFYLCV